MRWAFPLCCRAISHQVPCRRPCTVLSVGSCTACTMSPHHIPIPLMPLPTLCLVRCTVTRHVHPIRVRGAFPFEVMRQRKGDCKHPTHITMSSPRSICIADRLTTTFCRALSTTIETGTCDYTLSLLLPPHMAPTPLLSMIFSFETDSVNGTLYT